MLESFIQSFEKPASAGFFFRAAIAVASAVGYKAAYRFVNAVDARDLLRTNGISTGSLATLFERMQKAHDKRGSKSDWPTYLSTHPPTPERIELFRKPAN